MGVAQITAPNAVNTQQNVTKAQTAGLVAPVNAPVKAVDEAAKIQTQKDTQQYSVGKVSKAALIKARFYKPDVQVGMYGEPLSGSFAPPIVSYANRAKGVSLSDIADNGVGSFRTGRAGKSSTVKPNTGCETCAKREYKDGSNDAGVSFKTASRVPSAMAGVAVASHEGEHVSRESDKANKEDRVVTQSKVTFQYATCPECHKMYIAGGTTTISTMSASAKSESALSLFGMPGNESDEQA